MDYIWQRLIATALILGVVLTLGLCHVISGEAAIGIIGLAGGLWFGQFIPSTIGESSAPNVQTTTTTPTGNPQA